MAYVFTGIDHVQLAAPKGMEKEIRAFFTGKLGFEEIPKPEKLRARGGCWFRCGTQELHIGVEENFQPAKKAHPAFCVENLQAFRTHLEEQGLTIKEEPPIEGRERLFIDDPFGNRIEFLEYKA
ncbi:VOC family protein [Priestia taiwanensis]|uniref:Glyoxalase n=1 Tax=Priestia taiwanensis TaxID=1347902 RepID=A0A917ASA9_9BACI|nr:VOC family protein [Priestia taiwanensis]MBM7363277.1 catechol 2,3-dioxygenase-like lactoylglutathione lyase family enzyme [Priestia taiwanensis]GGE69085.1 glyoxalase [Priestia taiwanensis]